MRRLLLAHRQIGDPNSLMRHTVVWEPLKESSIHLLLVAGHRYRQAPNDGLLTGCGEDEQRHEREVDEKDGFDQPHGDEEGREHSLLGLGLASYSGDYTKA